MNTYKDKQGIHFGFKLYQKITTKEVTFLALFLSCLCPEEHGWGRIPTIGWWSGIETSAASVYNTTKWDLI